jgi:long-chain fatty acid transport protein
MDRRTSLPILAAIVCCACSAATSLGQSFGIELHNTTMPASGGMGGVSIARPQDLISAIGANPASLAQFHGTQFLFGGAWIESTYNLSHVATAGLPNLGTFSAKSEAEGSALADIGVTQDLRALGIPATVGMGLLAGAGAGLSYRDVPESNGTSVTISILQIGSAVGLDLTDRLSLGGSLMLGNSTLDAPLQGIGAAAYAYQLRGSIGLCYELTETTDLGFYYQTRQNFNYDDAIRIDLGNGQFRTVQDVNAGLPENLGLGLANDTLLNGRLLLAADVLYKQWSTADLFNVLYKNQWVFQFGAQLAPTQRVRLRAGYVYAENPLDSDLSGAPGGVIPGGPLVAALRYTQATVAVANHHRLTAGLGIRDLLPGIDLNVQGGGMFGASEQLGRFTATDVKSYWLGAGMTWRFGRGHGHPLPVADRW